MMDDTLLDLAQHVATNAYKGQKRHNGDPYITHPERVAAALNYLDAKIIAWLHDVVEDTDVTLNAIRADFGDTIADAVDSVTKRKGESYLDFILRAKLHPIGAGVKIADIKDNLRDLKRGSLRDKYILALHILTDGS